MRESRAALAALFGLAFFGCAGAPEPATSPPRAERPMYEIGEKWIRDDGIYELVRIENDLYILSAGPNREIHLSRDLFPARIIRGSWALAFSPPPPLPWPLEVGKVETSNGTVSYRGPAPISFRWTVDRYEDVQVPAGTFKAFRLSLDGGMPIGGSDRIDLKTWYAPEVRQFVKAESRVTGGYYPSGLDLLSFKVVGLDQVREGPLSVTLESPVDQVRVPSERLAIIGKATSGRGIVGVTVTLNAVEVARFDERERPKPILRLNLSVILREGQNVLLVTATDSAGETHQAARTVFYESAPKQAAARTLWAALREGQVPSGSAQSRPGPGATAPGFAQAGPPGGF